MEQLATYHEYSIWWTPIGYALYFEETCLLVTLSRVDIDLFLELEGAKSVNAPKAS